MLLSKNFTLEEMTKSQQGLRLGIDNTPSKDIIQNLSNLVVNILQPIRDALGKPIVISSGYRCIALNKAIGGSSTSDHCKGMAADIEIPGVDNRELFNYIRSNFKFKQVILEFYKEGVDDSGWVHVSYDQNNLKNESLLATSVAGKTVYSKV